MEVQNYNFKLQGGGVKSSGRDRVGETWTASNMVDYKKGPEKRPLPLVLYRGVLYGKTVSLIKLDFR